MIRAKKYETVSKCVKVMPKIPWPFFCRLPEVYTSSLRDVRRLR